MILATLCYIRHKGKTLMMHRNKRVDDLHKGKWNGLGGKFLPGESPEECVKREVNEESGLTIKEPKLKGILLFNNFKGDNWYVFVFVANKFEGVLKENEEGELHWIDDKELTKLELWPSDRVFIQWLDRQGIFSAKFYYDGESYKSEYEVSFY